ncbi:hypothetical protein C1T17_02380 [Sphingobium sp. SCG-1]|uniref:TonB-dependent receptor n=1 Tax=Sphingobium sp. SCG-1 TaxID=2072936 RepID=UPI000CD69CDA|nr:TonB-dependent receptor [Sphingobium sp. SCG-1]AUW57101.1 hypothetical protein C1T17_02380 [Sphingobium sp. SCG-1]
MNKRSRAGSRQKIKAALLLAGCSCAGHTWAQAPAKTALAQDAAPEIGEIVVTAQRREQRLSEVPLSVQAASGEALRQAGITDSRALEQISPAVSFNSNYSTTTTTLVIRGAASIAQEGGIQPSVGVVIDGVPVARQGEFVADLADIDRVEVLSGPQGTLFGKNSTAGVINIISNRPKHQMEASFDLLGTFDGEIIPKAMVNVPVGDNVALRMNGYYHYIKPQIENLAGPDIHGQRSWGGQAKLLFDVSERTNILLSGSYNNFYSTFGNNFVVTPNSGPFGDFQRLVFGPIGWGVDVANQDTISYSRNRLYALVGELNSELSDNLSLVAIAGYRNSLNRTEIDVDAGPIGVNPGRGISPNPFGYPLEYVATEDDHQVERYKYWSQELRLAYSAPGIDVVAGAYYQDYKETRQLLLPFLLDGSAVPDVPVVTPAGARFFNSDELSTGLTDKTMAAFADVTYEIVPTVNLFGGLRYTHEKLRLTYRHDVFFNPATGFFNPITVTNTAPPVDTQNFISRRSDDNLSGRIGVQWQPTRSLNYYASYNRGYKGSAANQGRTAGSLVRAANDSSLALIDPEIAEAFEIGAKQRFLDGRLTFNLALYKQIIKNIQQTAVTQGISVDLINAGDLKIDGFEFVSTAQPFEGLNLSLGVVYNKARYSGHNFFPCGPSDTRGVGKCGINGLQDLDGQRAISSPKWKVVTSAAYETPMSEDLKLMLRVAYNWRSSIQFQLFEDPLTAQPAYGLLDASIGFGSIDDKWALTLFGKNLTNKFYYGNLNTGDGFIGQQFGNIPRDYKRYGGLRLTYKM